MCKVSKGMENKEENYWKTKEFIGQNPEFLKFHKMLLS